MLTNWSKFVFQLTLLNRYISLILFVFLILKKTCLKRSEILHKILKPFGAQKNASGGLTNLNSLVNGIFLSAQDRFTGRLMMGGCPDEELFDHALINNTVINNVKANFF